MSVMFGTYLRLHQYLEHRYADTVVLTFAQMEDLLGFTLPDAARRQQEWWTHASVEPLECGVSSSWLQAGRAATPNLAAGIVAFARARGHKAA